MISDENIRQLRALIESILDEKLGPEKLTMLLCQEINRALDARNLKRSPDVTAAERMRRYRERLAKSVTLRNGVKRNGSEGKAVTLRNGQDVIGDGEIICVVNGLRGPVEVRQSYIKELMEAYPGVMVAQEIERARIWLDDNPTKRKQNVRRFLTGWVRRKQG